MRETENERRFKRGMILARVNLHLAQQRDMALPRWVFQGISEAHTLVFNLQISILEEELKELELK
jgi:hypothetical protein